MISSTAEEMLAFTNAVPEWLCKQRQEKVFLFLELINYFHDILRDHIVDCLCSCLLVRHCLVTWSLWERESLIYFLYSTLQTYC